MKQGSLVVVYLKLLLTTIFWGGTFIAARFLTHDVGPFSAAFLRFAIASVVLMLILWHTDEPVALPRRHHIFPILLLGITGIFLYNLLFFKGLKLIEAGRASVIIANNPIFIALLSAYFFKEILTPLKIVGILISTFGAVVVVTKGHVLTIFQGNIGLGELYIFGCVASWVSYSLIGKALMKDLSPLLSVAYSVLTGTVLLFLPAVQEGLLDALPSYSWSHWASLFYMGLFGTVFGFLFFYEGIVRIGPTKAGLFINFVPISAITLAYLLLDEPITFSLLIGLLFVSGGVYLTTRKTAAEGEA